MLPLPELEAILPTLPTVAVNKRLHRVVNLEHYESSDPSLLLYDEGPLRSAEGQRFTPAAPAGFRGIYAAEDLITAGSEFSGSKTKWSQGACPNHVGFKIDIDLKAVLDLTDAKVRRNLDTTLDEILSPWLGHAAIFGTWPATWNLGDVVHNLAIFDGIRFPSEKNRPKGRNLLILTSCLANTGGTITICNSDGSPREKLPK